MTTTDSSLEVSPPLRHGPTPRPEGEQAPPNGHPRVEEEIGGALAKPGSSTPSPRDSSGPPDESGGGETPELESNSIEIVRATTKFRIDLSLLSAHLNRDRPHGAKRIVSDEERAAADALAMVAVMATTAKNAAARAQYRKDSDEFDRYLAAHGEPPRRAADWIVGKTYSYPVICAAAPHLATPIAATLQRAVDAKWAQERYDVLVRQVRSPPHYRVDQPIPIPAAVVRWAWDAPHAASMTIPLLSTKAPQAQKRYTFPLAARDEHQRTVLERLASGEWRAGQVLLKRDRLHRDRWFAVVQYKRRVPKRTGGIAAAINRGMRTFLCAVTERGENWIYDADDIVAYLRQVQRRRREYQRGYPASARIGHGRPRALKSIEHLAGKAARWRDTRCQVLARRLSRWLAARDVSVVYLEDFASIRDQPIERADGGLGRYIWERIQEWPYYQLGQRLTSCLEEEGIRVVVQSSAYHSQRCPACGLVDPAHRDLARWQLRHAPHFRRHLDVAHCMNSLARGAATDPNGPRKIDGLAAWSEEQVPTARRPTAKLPKRKKSCETGGNE